MLERKFGEILKYYRINCKFSQQKLAFDSELDRTYISLLERGKRMPTIDTLFKLSKALSILPSEFIYKLEQSQ